MKKECRIMNEKNVEFIEIKGETIVTIEKLILRFPLPIDRTIKFLKLNGFMD